MKMHADRQRTQTSNAYDQLTPGSDKIRLRVFQGPQKTKIELCGDVCHHEHYPLRLWLT